MAKPDVADLADREVELLQQVHTLRQALQVTLDYLQSELQPEPPSNIASYRALLAEPDPSLGVATDPVRDFANVVTAMARFFNNVGAMEIFDRISQTAFLEWIILTSVAAEPPGLTDRELCRLIGANHKRTRRMLQAMAEAGLVSLSAAGQPGSPSIQVAAAGGTRLAEINGALLPLLRRFVHRVPLQLRYLLRSLRLLARFHDKREERTRR